MDITKILMSQLGDGGLEAMSGKIGADKQKTSAALEGILPTLLGAMSSNAKSPEGANGLLSALDRDHDGSILDDVMGFLGGADSGSGAGILKHVLGTNQASVENSLGEKTGLKSSQISSLLQMAAPLLLGYLGKQKKQQAHSGGFDLGGLTGMLGGLAGEADKGTGLDLGDLMSMVSGMSGGNQATSVTGKSGRGIGGLLGKLFGR